MAEEKRPLILVVDDNQAGRYVTAGNLRRAGFEVTEAATGDEALKQAGQLPDLILLDVKLPDMSGFEVCAALKKDPQTKSIPVVHLSAEAIDSPSRIHGLDGGADGYLIQPINERELTAVINAMLRMGRAENALCLELKEKEKTIGKLEEALKQVKTLSGLIPICMHCKKIRNDEGYWEQLEVYISAHSQAEFSHALCDLCREKYYPEDVETTANPDESPLGES